jgi:hypothetical protein
LYSYLIPPTLIDHSFGLPALSQDLARSPSDAMGTWY